MNKITGYKGMLRDRCPKTTNFALKYLKAKERWINHVYDCIIQNAWKEYKNNNLILSLNDCKKHLTRLVLGIKKGKITNFNFDYTIDWDNLTQEETEYWEKVSGWVKWFKIRYSNMQKEYRNSRENGISELDTKVTLINSYLKDMMPKENDNTTIRNFKLDCVDNLINFLVDCFEGKIK